MRKPTRWLLIVILLALIVSACVPAAAPEAATGAQPAGETTSAATRTTLVVGAPVVTDILDAQQTYDNNLISTEQIGQALVRIDPATGEFLPDLAESLTFSEDGKTLTIKLPADAVYANGDPVDAQALMDAWTRYKTISPYAVDLAAVTAMMVKDATTLEVTFSAPPASSYAFLETSFGGAWNAAEAAKVGDPAFAIAPVSTGPLTVKEFTPSADLTMVRNDNYKTNLPNVQNKGPLHLEEVQVRAIAEVMTLASELEAGNIDLMMQVPATALERLQTNPDIQVYELGLALYSGLALNRLRAPFDDLKVRQAVAQAIDREALVKVLGPSVQPHHTFLVPAMIAYSAEAESAAQARHPYDVEAAKALIAEAGWADSDGDGIVEKDGAPFSVEILVNANNNDANLMAQVFQTQFKAIGIDLQIRQQDPKANREAVAAGEFAVAFDGVSWRDPDVFSQMPIFAAYIAENADLAAKFDAARQQVDPAQRVATYAEIQQILGENVIEIPLLQRKGYIATRTWVKGLAIDPNTGYIYLNDVTIEE